MLKILGTMRPGIVAPLAVCLGASLGVVFGASAVALSPAAANAVEIALTSVSCSSTSACVAGSNSSVGPGVAGTSARGIGVNGASRTSYGLFGTSTSGVGVKAVSNGGSAVFATNDSPSYPTINGVQSGAGPAVSGSAHAGSGVSGQSTTAAGVYGTSGSGPGVSGESADSNGTGVLGTLDLHGSNLGTNAAGVRGDAPDMGIGVFAHSQNYEAIVAQSDNDMALLAYGAVGGDLEASGPNGTGLTVGSLSGVAASFSTGNSADVLDLQGGTTGSGAYLINASSSDGTKYMRVDDSGNVFISGQMFTAGPCNSGCISKRIGSYAPRESEPTVEDVGTGRLVSGSASVSIDPTFRSVIDANTDYHVLITPEGDSNGLFVAGRSARSFLVRENRGGRSSLTFSYRIVATPFGPKQPRLPIMAMPAPKLQRSTLHRNSSRYHSAVPAPRPVVHVGQ